MISFKMRKIQINPNNYFSNSIKLVYIENKLEKKLTILNIIYKLESEDFFCHYEEQIYVIIHFQ